MQIQNNSRANIHISGTIPVQLGFDLAQWLLHTLCGPGEHTLQEQFPGSIGRANERAGRRITETHLPRCLLPALELLQ